MALFKDSRPSLPTSSEAVENRYIRRPIKGFGEQLRDSLTHRDTVMMIMVGLFIIFLQVRTLLDIWFGVKIFWRRSFTGRQAGTARLLPVTLKRGSRGCAFMRSLPAAIRSWLAVKLRTSQLVQGVRTCYNGGIDKQRRA